jgi:uncharacterized membrane protein YphA (DoxX/SURF4 family)
MCGRFLALFFLAAGVPKILGRGPEQWTGFANQPRSLVIFIGLTEVLGAAGLVLPMATGTLPWLTPLAAVGLAIIVLIATGFHIRADERLTAVKTALWATIAVVVAISRWDLVASRADVPPWVLMVALGLLVPSAVVNAPSAAQLNHEHRVSHFRQPGRLIGQEKMKIAP